VAKLGWVALFGWIVFAAQAQEPLDQDVVRGRAIAASVCSACHVVAADQTYAPILRNPGPSFQSIANKPTTTADALRRFISTTHQTAGEPFRMPNPELTAEMQEQVVVYILSLRNRH
jgi:mono/diheme cytochrome c family protein